MDEPVFQLELMCRFYLDTIPSELLELELGCSRVLLDEAPRTVDDDNYDDNEDDSV